MHNYNTVWLVDIGYVTKASRDIFKLDYLAARDFLQERCGPTKGMLFNGYDLAYGIPDGLDKFYGVMRGHGLDVRLHPMMSGEEGMNRQRRVDVDLCARMVWEASLDHVKWVILTTGDQDFIPAVELLRERSGKRVVLFTYNKNVHLELARNVDEWWRFEDDEDRLTKY